MAKYTRNYAKMAVLAVFSSVEKENECTNSTAALKPCRATPIIKYDFKDARERLGHLFIDTTA